MQTLVREIKVLVSFLLLVFYSCTLYIVCYINHVTFKDIRIKNKKGEKKRKYGFIFSYYNYKN